MSNEELVALIQTGNDVKTNMGILYQQNEGAIRKIAAPYSQKVEMEDLLQEAFFGIVAAVKGFDPLRGLKFMTYAQYKIHQKIVRYCHNNGNTKRIPSHKINIISKYHKFKKEYSVEFGNEPNELEYMEHLELNLKAFKELKKLISEISCLSIDLPIAEDQTLGEVLSNNYNLESDVVERLTNDQLSVGLWKAVDELDERQKVIIINRYKEQKSVVSIAEEKGLSSTRIGQLEKKALRHLYRKQEVLDIAIEHGYERQENYKYGVQRFKDTRTSSTEYVALRTMEIEARMTRVNALLEDLANF